MSAQQHATPECHHNGQGVQAPCASAKGSALPVGLSHRNATCHAVRQNSKRLGSLRSRFSKHSKRAKQGSASHSLLVNCGKVHKEQMPGAALLGPLGRINNMWLEALFVSAATAARAVPAGWTMSQLRPGPSLSCSAVLPIVAALAAAADALCPPLRICRRSALLPATCHS